MAESAAHILVRTLEAEGGPGVVVEQRRLPFVRVVATCAVGLMRCVCKLPAVYVLVAAVARQRRAAEIHVHQLDFQPGWTVAIDAGHGAMRSQQWELGGRMIKAGQLVPGLHGVAGFATRRLALRGQLEHAVAELAFVRIFVAAGAGAVGEAELGYLFELRRKALLVAVSAGGRQVRAQERKMRVFVLRQGKGGGLEAVHVVAAFAFSKVGRGGKLAQVNVLMAGRALVVLDHI